MTLTEKEIIITGSGITIELFAEFSDGKLTSIHALLDIDGYRLSGPDKIGCRIFDGWNLTSFYVSLLLCLNSEIVSKLEAEVRDLINGN